MRCSDAAPAAQSAPCGLCTAYPARGGVRSCSWPWAALGREARPALGGTSECSQCRGTRSTGRSKRAQARDSTHSVGDSIAREWRLRGPGADLKGAGPSQQNVEPTLRLPVTVTVT